jgi:N utilization substance protein B
MSLPLQKFREIVFLTLFSHLTGDPVESETVKLYMEQLKTSKAHVMEGIEKAKAIQKMLPEIDALLSQHTEAFEFERIQTVEKTALRFATYELLFDKDIPPKVAISEALRLTKKFSTSSAVAFVNAILDKVYAITRK